MRILERFLDKLKKMTPEEYGEATKEIEETYMYIYHELGFEGANFSLRLIHDKRLSSKEFELICNEVLIEYHTKKIEMAKKPEHFNDFLFLDQEINDIEFLSSLFAKRNFRQHFATEVFNHCPYNTMNEDLKTIYNKINDINNEITDRGWEDLKT